MENLINELIEAAKNALYEMPEHCQPKTKILNAEYALGKFFGYMEILSKIDLEVFIATYESHKARIDELTALANKIYE